MRRGICVKCGAATVRAAKNGVELGGDRTVRTYLRPNLGPGFKGMVRNQETDLWAFGCTTCGYIEWFLLDPAGIAFVNQHWMPVPPPAESPPPPPSPSPPPA